MVGISVLVRGGKHTNAYFSYILSVNMYVLDDDHHYQQKKGKSDSKEKQMNTVGLGAGQL